MLEASLHSRVNENIGKLIFIASLIFYLVITLPFTLCVAVGNANEGFYYVNSQFFLEGKHLYTDIFHARGPLFFLFYAMILKFFGFSIWSVIAIHLFHKLIIVLIGIVIYLMVKKLLKSAFWAGLSVLFWILIEVTPIGGWGGVLEFGSILGLEAEYFCILFSLFSIYFSMLSVLNQSDTRQSKLLSLVAGILAACSMLFKASGAVLVIAFFGWFIYLLFYSNRSIRNLKHVFIFFSVGLFVSLLLAHIAIYLHNGDLASFWFTYFLAGNYGDLKLTSIQSFLSIIHLFMLRHSSSLSNFILFLSAFVCFAWGLVRNYFVKKDIDSLELFAPLMSIWGVGSTCAVIAPSWYGSYYYELVLPSVAVSLVLGLRDLFAHLKPISTTAFKLVVCITIIAFFSQRLWRISPTYLHIAKTNLDLNIFSQPESFQDPVKLPNDQSRNPKRRGFLKVADLINSYLPNKNDRFYVLNFTKGHQSLGPQIYIYAKRLSASPIVSDWLFVEKVLDRTLPILKRDLKRETPKIIIVPKNLYLHEWQKKALSPFLYEIALFLKENYHIKTFFSYKCCGMKENEEYLVYERS